MTQHKLVIAEKPSVAKSIAAVVGADESRDGYLEGNGYRVSWCLGHLVELADAAAYGDAWKKWSYESLPVIPLKWKYEVKTGTKQQYDILKNLMSDSGVSEVVCATDAGREGELIFRLVYQQGKCTKPVKRLWISSMEEKAIEEGFENLKAGQEYENLYQSALCRSMADWLVGINATRLFSVLYHHKLTVGRVQTPTLAMLVNREEQISGFRKEKYYVVHSLCGGVDAVTANISDRKQAEQIVAACGGRDAVVQSVTCEKDTVSPPKLYDLTTLQRSANRILGYTAQQTLDYTQSLYEKKLVTYPRTDSQYLTDDMEQTALLIAGAAVKAFSVPERISSFPDASGILNSKKVSDHHAIIPTMEIGSIDLKGIPDGERRILNLIVGRMVCAMAQRHVYETVKVAFSCQGHTFEVTGKSVLIGGWKDAEAWFLHETRKSAEEQEEKSLPILSEGMVFEDVECRITEHFTSPPKHFTEDTMLLGMERAGSDEMDDDVERKGLGTPATRAAIIEKLVERGFVERREKQMIPTGHGRNLIAVLPDVVKSPQLTAEWENALTLVAKGQTTAAAFMTGIEEMVKGLVQDFHEADADKKGLFAVEREVLGKCPKCGSDVVTGKFGAYCVNKCGMNVARAMGAVLSDNQARSILEGKKTLLKGLKGKKGSYDAWLIPEGVEDYSYMKDGKEMKGSQYKIRLEFPKRKK